MFPQLKDIIAKTIRFRYMLLPYLYSLLYYSHIRGRLIARALAYEFQDYDFVNCANESEKFMLGPYLLVAGVLDPMSKLSKKDKRKQINKIINKNDDY
jgi:alpha-glucosidase